MKNAVCFFFVFTMITAFPLRAAGPVGTINGKVSEYLKNRIIPGVHVQVMNTKFAAVTDENGKFKIVDIPVGSYNVKFSIDGFKPVIKTDVMVRPQRITYLNIEMQEQLFELRETVEVSASYFSKSEENPNSVFNISAEEVRRAPGTIGDISRSLLAVPGITSMGDENTDLMVRGGCPLENGFFVDNIEIPNINHLPRLGSTGGVISALNQDLVQSVDFFTGGFSSDYGDRLSSITDIKLREGNRKEFDGQIDLNLVQTGGVLEGPFAHGKGSWLVSLRKSYFELLKQAGILQVDAVPNTMDSQVKVTYDISPKHKINILDILVKGSYEEDYEGENVHEDNRYTQNTFGINWIASWNEKFISNTSLSYSFLNRRDGETFFYQDGSNWQWYTDDSAEYFILRNINYLFFNNRNKLLFGGEIKHQSAGIDHFVGGYRNWMGDQVPGRILNFAYKTINTGLFFSYIWKPFKRLTTTIGLRGDHWSAHEMFRLSPRFSFSYALSPRFSLSGGFGVFYQAIPMRLLAYWPWGLSLNHMQAIHYTAGFEYFPGPGTRITLEAYDKEYKHLPIDPFYPRGLVTDQFIDSYYTPASFVDVGAGFSRGIELLIHKKLVKRFYGIFSATYFRSRYKDLEGQWWNRIFDNRYIINLSGGYKPNNKWEFGLKWTLVGGGPYTPYDIARSRQENQGIQDLSRFLGARLPAYSTLNLRVDRRFYFGKSSLIFYLDIWNVFNRKNIYEYDWNNQSKSVEEEHQLTLLPLLGIEYEFW